MQKTLTFLSFVEGKTKEAFCFYNVFWIGYILKTKRKPAEKKNREMFSHQFVAHVPKVGKSEQKKKQQQQQPKIRHRLLMPPALQLVTVSATHKPCTFYLASTGGHLF